MTITDATSAPSRTEPSSSQRESIPLQPQQHRRQFLNIEESPLAEAQLHTTSPALRPIRGDLPAETEGLRQRHPWQPAVAPLPGTPSAAMTVQQRETAIQTRLAGLTPELPEEVRVLASEVGATVFGTRAADLSDNELGRLAQSTAALEQSGYGTVNDILQVTDWRLGQVVCAVLRSIGYAVTLPAAGPRLAGLMPNTNTAGQGAATGATVFGAQGVSNSTGGGIERALYPDIKVENFPPEFQQFIKETKEGNFGWTSEFLRHIPRFVAIVGQVAHGAYTGKGVDLSTLLQTDLAIDGGTFLIQQAHAKRRALLGADGGASHQQGVLMSPQEIVDDTVAAARRGPVATGGAVLLGAGKGVLNAVTSEGIVNTGLALGAAGLISLVFLSDKTIRDESPASKFEPGRLPPGAAAAHQAPLVMLELMAYATLPQFVQLLGQVQQVANTTFKRMLPGSPTLARGTRVDGQRDDADAQETGQA